VCPVNSDEPRSATAATMDQSQPTREELEKGLQAIRRRRRLKHGPVFGLLLLIASRVVLSRAAPALGQTLDKSILFHIVFDGAFACCVLLGFVPVVTLRCPRCHQFFHAGRYRNDLARRCLTCGFRLDGSNVADALSANDRYHQI
jgi:hypothetical protein